MKSRALEVEKIKGTPLYIEASKKTKATKILVTNEVAGKDQKFFELMFN